MTSDSSAAFGPLVTRTWGTADAAHLAVYVDSAQHVLDKWRRVVSSSSGQPMSSLELELRFRTARTQEAS